ncbi:helix-turn-helix transcriptional regulator [Haloglomus halophilum]|uniref:helix-turn-helix transcriptional regulator n=1 Tax=Haloglomus halophilum TaxID=2962672 RepID=UPI0020C9936D|nr:MarR family transcriptional regulator [Haloglomus halophilum]
MSTADEEADLSEDEQAGLELIRQIGSIHQSDFWKELDVDSRKGSRILESLEEKGLIEREKTVYEGHNTYHIEPVHDPRDLDFSLLMAGDMLSPFIGDEEIDATSDQFSQYIMTLAYEEY